MVHRGHIDLPWETGPVLINWTQVKQQKRNELPRNISALDTLLIIRRNDLQVSKSMWLLCINDVLVFAEKAL